LNEHQQLAVEQLQDIASRTNDLEIVAVMDSWRETSSAAVDVSIRCEAFEREDDGLPLRARERFTILIPKGFPYDVPEVFVRHRRFAGYPHVNWRIFLCLYVAPQTEWNPSNGMHGFMRRLELWLRQAALGQLDPVGGPMHPPATYKTTGPTLIPRTNAPEVSDAPWLGSVDLHEMHESRIDLLDWQPPNDSDHITGAAILLDKPMPFEFPEKIGSLLDCLSERGVSRDELFELLHGVVSRNGNGKQLVILVGTPMRGVRGEKPKQHLTAWRVPAFGLDVLDLDERAARLGDVGVELHEKVRTLFESWAKDTEVEYCRIREDRPEVTERRDIGRRMRSFSGKTVEVWGCGALGANMAEWIVRAGAKKVIVLDQSIVTPGILVRQPYQDSDIGKCKARVLATRLRGIDMNCEIEHVVDDAVDRIQQNQISEDIDIILDATASQTVLVACEEGWKSLPAMATFVIDAEAQRGMSVLAMSGRSGGPMDVTRRMKIECCYDDRLKVYSDSFFPKEPPKVFQPEPGCSDATFIGSAVDVSTLAGLMLNRIANRFDDIGDSMGAGLLVSNAELDRSRSFEFESDQCFVDPSTGYETRVSPVAWRQLHAWARRSQRRNGQKVETGGLLFGERSDLLRTVWVSEVCGPPADSEQSAEEFVCGVQGTLEIAKAKQERSRGSVGYVGTWHTHPTCGPCPSPKDFMAMLRLLTDERDPPKRLLLLIVARPYDEPEVTATVFEREEFESLRTGGSLVRTIASAPAESFSPVTPSRPIGLCLSGGGSRAMAFHLGCLRALRDRGMLNKVDVLSTVSGGSVIGAMYSYSDDSFADFELRVHEALKRGFMKSIARQLFLSPILFQVLGTKVVAGTVATGTSALRASTGLIERLLPKSSRATATLASRMQPPLRRWASRTTAFEAALGSRLFSKRLIDSKRRGDINVVINACELRTGTAFRFGNRETGSWRFGTLENNNATVALAVAASAAYPALLPAIDRMFRCIPRRGGEPADHRLILTDGGVYENLGVTCMEPGRDADFSTNVYSPDYIICCDAGPGQFDDTAHPYGWASRMQRSFETTHRQVQHGVQSRLHHWREQGVIKGFVYSYLGQQDNRLPSTPSELVRRERVVNYPTDFSPMPELDIMALSNRGEQLTRLLIDHYCPEL